MWQPLDHDAAQKNYSSIIKESKPTSIQQSKTSVQSEKKSSKSNMNYDDILEELGESGRWQLLHLALLWLPSMAGGIFVLTYSFSGKYSQTWPVYPINMQPLKSNSTYLLTHFHLLLCIAQ